LKVKTTICGSIEEDMYIRSYGNGRARIHEVWHTISVIQNSPIVYREARTTFAVIDGLAPRFRY
jgi:uncharacterized protein